MKLSSLAGAALLGNLISLVTAASIELTHENIAKELQSGTWVIEHFSQYCVHCLQFAPEWTKLSNDLDYLADFHFGTIDCSIRGDLCAKHDVHRYPEIQLWENGKKLDTYPGMNKYDPLTAYILNKVNSQQQTQEQETQAENTEGDEEKEGGNGIEVFESIPPQQVIPEEVAP